MHSIRPMFAWLFFAILFTGCQASRSVRSGGGESGGNWIAVDTHSGKAVDLNEMSSSLARCDVVFLGEEHDQDIGHALQLELTMRILELRPNASLSFEMIERDAQEKLDRYLEDEIGESDFLSKTRPWPNYKRHYRPMLLLAKEKHLPVIAANVPRPLAARV